MKILTNYGNTFRDWWFHMTTNTPKLLDTLTIGADPEFFVMYKNSPIPAYKTGITGTKKEPTPLKTGGGVQVDGMALEFNIPPVTNGKDFYDVTLETLYEIRRMVDRDLTFNFIPQITFNIREFEATPEIYKELGCDPDYDATQDGIEKTPPSGSGDKPFRTCGGHLHIGWIDPSTPIDPRDPLHIYDCNYVIQNLEYNFFYHSHYNRHLYPERATLYGSPGSYRPKGYGVEWRTPSNLWLNYPRQTLIHFINGCLEDTKKLFTKHTSRKTPVDINYDGFNVKSNTTQIADEMIRKHFYSNIGSCRGVESLSALVDSYKERGVKSPGWMGLAEDPKPKLKPTTQIDGMVWYPVQSTPTRKIKKVA